MLRELESMCLGVFGTLAMILALCNLYGTFATNDYRPIFVQGLAFWLLGSLCLWGLRRRGRLNRGFFLFIWGLLSLPVGVALFECGPYMFFGLDW